MAYTRFNIGGYKKGWAGNIPPSDTYIYGSMHYLNCCGCRLMPIAPTAVHFDRMEERRNRFNARMKEAGMKDRLPPVDRSQKFIGFDTYITTSRRDMLKHIRHHRKAGHAVPRAAWRRLVREIRTVGNRYP